MIYDVCYFFYEIDKVYQNFYTNRLCNEKNQTEADFPNPNTLYILLYLTQIYKLTNGSLFDVSVPWKFFSK